MERQRRQQQEAAAALHAALVLLNRGGVCKEPLSPTMFAKPNLKGLQAVLHLLYLRIRGAARTKKELQHVYPVLEPAQARDFKAAMQAWIKEMGAAGVVLPDTVKYFVTAYSGSNSHRTILMLLDLSTVALAKELGEGPQDSLPSVELVQPDLEGGRGRLLRGAQQAAAAALQQGRARMDEVVAAMQRLKQLQDQAVGQLLNEQVAGGPSVGHLLPKALPLFSGSQASARRGELVLELLSRGPSLTLQPEVVGPDSWTDLLSAGKVLAGSMAAQGARRLSNPQQEASNFAAEGMAADADPITVHSVVLQRYVAAGSALQAASGAGSAELRAALAEAAVWRGMLVTSVRQELASAKLRAEQQAPAAGDSGPCGGKLQLPPPGQPPCNPVLEGLQAAQQAAAAAAAVEAVMGAPPGPACSSAGWAPADGAAVQSLRDSMWQRVQAGATSAARPASATSLAVSPLSAENAAAHSAVAAAGSVPGSPISSSASKARRAAARVRSPALEDLLSNTRDLAALPLLSEGAAEELAEAAFGSCSSGGGLLGLHQQHGQSPRRQLPFASPCAAESCASASVVGDSHSQHGTASSAAAAGAVAEAAAGAGSRYAGSRLPRLQPASPMLSAAGRPAPMRQQEPRQLGAAGRQGPGHSASSAAAALVPPLRLGDMLSAPSRAVEQYRASAAEAGNTIPEALSCRAKHACEAPQAATAPMLAPAAGSGRLPAAQGSANSTPRGSWQCNGDGAEQQQQHPAGLGSPFILQMSGSSGEDGTPASKVSSSGSSSAEEDSQHPAAPAVLQPLQKQQLQAGSGTLAEGSPGSPLLASCLKTKRSAGLLGSPFALASALDGELAEQLPAAGGSSSERRQQTPLRWTLAAVRAPSAPSPGSSLNSPRGSAGASLKRSAVVTTNSPRLRSPAKLGGTPGSAAAASRHRYHMHRLASAGAGAGTLTPVPGPPLGAAAARRGADDDLLGPPRALDTPDSQLLLSRGGHGSPARTCSWHTGGAPTPPRSLLATPGSASKPSRIPSPANAKRAVTGGAGSNNAAVDALKMRYTALLSTKSSG